jgi:hypothetical protein
MMCIDKTKGEYGYMLKVGRFTHEGLEHISVDVINSIGDPVCAGCHQSVIPAKAYSAGITDGDKRYHYTVHKYCGVGSTQHKKYLAEIANGATVITESLTMEKRI